MEAFMTIWAFLIGLLIGKILTDLKWTNNSFEPQRILCFRKFYKVVDIDDFKSWDYLNIHKEEKNESK